MRPLFLSLDELGANLNIWEIVYSIVAQSDDLWSIEIVESEFGTAFHICDGGIYFEYQLYMGDDVKSS